MTHQIVYSSESTIPMQSDDLEEILEQARRNNGIDGVSGALVYTDRMFLQILEGERATVQARMSRIAKDLRHENVTILREGEVPDAQFSGWKMAFVSATREQVAKWAGIHVEPRAGEVQDDGGERERTAQFVHDILAMLGPREP